MTKPTPDWKTLTKFVTPCDNCGFDDQAKAEDLCRYVDNLIHQVEQEARQKALEEVRGLVEDNKQVGDFAGEGTMRILGVTAEDLTHDAKVYNQALSDLLKKLESMEG